MFKLMGKMQNWVLIVAGIATAGLFGISVTDIQGCMRSKELREMSVVSPEQRQAYHRKLKIGAALNGQSISGDDINRTINQYASTILKAQSEGLAVSNQELGLFIHNQFGDNYDRFAEGEKRQHGVAKGELEGYFRDQLLMAKAMQVPGLVAYVTRGEIKEEYHKRNDSFQYQQLLVDNTVLPEVVVDAAEVKAAYEEKKEEARFQIPEEVVVEALLVRPETIVVPEPSEEDLRQAYNQQRDRYPSEEFPGETRPFFEVIEEVKTAYFQQAKTDQAKRLLDSLDTILVQSEEVDLKATLEAEKATNPALEAVAWVQTEAFSQRDFRVDPLGYVLNLPRRLFGEHPRPYGGVLEAENGYYIYHLLKRVPPRTMSFEEAESILRRELSEEKALAQAKEKAMLLREKAVLLEDWSSLQEEGVVFSEEVARGLYSVESKALEGIEDGSVSEVLDRAGEVVILKRISKTPADKEGLKADANGIRQALLRQKQQLVEISILASLGN